MKISTILTINNKAGEILFFSEILSPKLPIKQGLSEKILRFFIKNTK
jgi:hypothetical protein